MTRRRSGSTARGADASAPYGRGGGGSLARLGIERDPAMVVVASLAKAFGAPLALVGGHARRSSTVSVADSETLVHCSPPAEPVLVAARRALSLEGTAADARRARLGDRVRRLRAALHARGFVVRGGLVSHAACPDARRGDGARAARAARAPGRARGGAARALHRRALADLRGHRRARGRADRRRRRCAGRGRAGSCPDPSSADESSSSHVSSFSSVDFNLEA